MSVVMFCGHKDLWQSDTVRLWLIETVRELIGQGANDFLLGGYGDFDRLAASVVRELKEKYPGVTSTLILPYLNKKVNETEATLYDSMLYPPIEKTPKRFAVSKRNEWMVSEADTVVAYVTHGWGGAAATLEYAKRKHKHIINYGTMMLSLQRPRS